MELIKGNVYNHPTIGNGLTYVRAYNYKGAKFQFRTANGQTLISMDFLETEELTPAGEHQ